MVCKKVQVDLVQFPNAIAAICLSFDFRTNESNWALLDRCVGKSLFPSRSHLTHPELKLGYLNGVLDTRGFKILTSCMKLWRKMANELYGRCSILHAAAFSPGWAELKGAKKKLMAVSSIGF